MKQILILLLLSNFIVFSDGQSQAPASQTSQPAKQAAARGYDNTDIVHCSLQDRTGKHWFGTWNGLYRYDGKTFTHFTESDGLRDNRVYAMLEDKAGNLWLGTGKGISRYDGKSFTGLALPIPASDLANFSMRYFSTNYGSGKPAISPMAILSITQDEEGNIWFGTRAYGTYRYDGKSFTRFSEKDGLDMCIQSIRQDRKGNIWFGTGRAELYRYDGASFTHLATKKLPGNFVLRPVDVPSRQLILEDKAGTIWFSAGRTGVFRYDGTAITLFPMNNKLDNRFVSSIIEDRKGNIWFGTDGGGVYRYNGTRMTRFTTEDGLCNNYVYSISEDRDGNLWFGTREGGLSRYDGNTFTDFSKSLAE
jgi:ligand-binding sensor domain-containing protein